MKSSTARRSQLVNSWTSGPEDAVRSMGGGQFGGVNPGILVDEIRTATVWRLRVRNLRTLSDCCNFSTAGGSWSGWPVED